MRHAVPRAQGRPLAAAHAVNLRAALSARPGSPSRTAASAASAQARTSAMECRAPWRSASSIRRRTSSYRPWPRSRSTRAATPWPPSTVGPGRASVRTRAASPSIAAMRARTWSSCPMRLCSPVSRASAAASAIVALACRCSPAYTCRRPSTPSRNGSRTTTPCCRDRAVSASVTERRRVSSPSSRPPVMACERLRSSMLSVSSSSSDSSGRPSAKSPAATRASPRTARSTGWPVSPSAGSAHRRSASRSPLCQA